MRLTVLEAEPPRQESGPGGVGVEQGACGGDEANPPICVGGLRIPACLCIISQHSLRDVSHRIVPPSVNGALRSMTSNPPTATVEAPASPDSAATHATQSRRSSLGAFGARFAVIGVWLALIALYGVLEPDRFLTTGTFQTIFGSQQAL